MSLPIKYVQSHLRGIAVGLLTPFDDDGAIQHERIRSNAQALWEKGIDTFLTTANISEYHSLSQQERVAVAETSIDALPEDACVVAGVGGSTADARNLIRSYDDIGVDAMMIMPPDHTYINERGLLKYYRKLGAATDSPLAPYVRQFNPSVDFLADLSKLDGIAGIKYAITDTVKLGAAVEAGADDVVWVNGLAEPLAVSTWAEGAEGFSAGVSNFRPEIGLALFDALTNEDWDRARQLRNACLPFQNFRDEAGEKNTIPGALSVPAVKMGLELAGLHGGDVREPICSLSSAEEQRVRSLYERLDEDIARLVK